MNAESPILLASDDNQVLSRWQNGLGARQTRICRSYPELEAALASGDHPACLIDLALAATSLNQCSDLIGRYPQCRFLALSAIPNEQECAQLLASGLRGYSNRLLDPSLLAVILPLIAAGQVWVGAPIMDRLIQRIQPHTNDEKSALLAQLTEREREIAGLIAQGLGNKMVARQLEISERTVKAHLSAIFQKTGAKDRLQLALRIK